MSRLFLSGGQSIGASAPVLPVNIQSWFPLGLSGLITLLSKGLSRIFSSTTVQNHQFFGAQPSLWSNSHICMRLLENHRFDYTDLCCKVMSLLFNVLSRFAITFLPRSKRLLISWLQSLSTLIWDPKNMKSDTVSTFPPSICHEVTGPEAMIFVFWMLSFKPAFSFSSLTFIKRLFSSSSFSAIRVMSSAYLRLLIFFLAFLILAYVSSSLAFCIMYSAYIVK